MKNQPILIKFDTLQQIWNLMGAIDKILKFSEPKLSDFDDIGTQQQI